MITPQHSTAAPSRRTVLRRALLTGAAALAGSHLTGCSPSSPQPETSAPSQSAPTTGSSGRRVLLVYFSRPGENYHYGRRTDLKVGNTEVLARKVSSRITCDTYRIQAADPYPHDYDATVRRNVHEQDTDARPGITGRLPALDGYNRSCWAVPSGTSEHR